MDVSAPRSNMNSYNWSSGNTSTSALLFYANTSETYSNETAMPVNEITVVIYAIVFVVGFLGNALAIFIVARYTKTKSITNMYILNLAVADLLYILGIPFIGTNSALYYWPYGDFLCKVCMTADGMSQFASTFCLTLMSIDRFIAVVYPIRGAKWRRPQVAKVFSGSVWVASFLMVLPVTIYSRVDEEINTCNIIWPEPSGILSVVFILYTSILGFFGPLVVISLCYLLIVIKVKSAGLRAGLNKRRRSERKVTRMVVVIVMVFVFCWLPFFTANIVNLISIIPKTNTTAAIYFSLVILTYVNSCANPFLYGLLSDNFKQSIQRVLCLKTTKGVEATDTTRNRENAAKSVQMEVIRNPDCEPFTSKTVMNGQ